MFLCTLRSRELCKLCLNNVGPDGQYSYFFAPPADLTSCYTLTSSLACTKHIFFILKTKYYEVCLLILGLFSCVSQSQVQSIRQGLVFLGIVDYVDFRLLKEINLGRELHGLGFWN